MLARFRSRALLASFAAALAVAAAVVGIVMTSAAPTPTLRGEVVRSGSGTGLSRTFELGSGLTILSATTSGRSPSYFWIRASNGELLPWQLELTLAETSGASLDVVPAGTYRLSAATTGPWSVTITQPRPTTGASVPHSFTGSGDEVVGPVEVPGYVGFSLVGQSGRLFSSNASIAEIAGLTRSDLDNCGGDSDDVFTQVGPTYIAVTSYEPGSKWILQVAPARRLTGVFGIGGC
jgi:hypothetical protein